MRVSVSTIVFLVSILVLSVFVAKVTNFIATDVPILRDGSNSQTMESIEPKFYNIDDSPDHLMWFLQVSDLHISIFRDASRITELKEFCDVTVGAINPSVVVASGDLTDAKTKDTMGSKQTLQEWKHYKNVLDESGVTKKTTWLDVRGNHDNFNVLSLNSSENFYLNYSIQGKKHPRSYMHQVMKGSEKYSFIAIDACLEPGPKRPFNFIGMLDELEMQKVIKLAEDSVKAHSNYIIWFGHYPTSSILSQYKQSTRDVIGKYVEGLVYLCGHYHTLGGVSPEMYTLQRGGFLELELADWKDNRMYRLAAIDHGQFSFTDIKHREWPVVLITNPKHALYAMPLKENLRSIAKSTHIRILAFSTVHIKNVWMKINDEPWIECVRIKGPLYIAKWNTSKYEHGIHHIHARVIDVNDRENMIKQPFSLDGTRLSFRVFPRLILMSDATTVFGISFGVMLVLTVFPLCIFRICHKLCLLKKMRRSHIRIRIINCCLRKMWILSTIDRFFYPLAIYPLYLAVGPWAVGEIIENEIGVIFAWGTYIGKSYLPGSFTYTYGFYQLLSFHVPLTILLAHRVDKQFQVIEKPPQKPPTILLLFWRHLPFMLLIFMQTSMAYFFWLAYGTVAAILCPLRTWTIILAIVLWYQANKLPAQCLKSASLVWSTSKQLSTTE